MDAFSFRWGGRSDSLQEAEPESSTVANSERPEGADSPQNASESRPRSRRLESLDAFRGFTILGMLLVNNLTQNGVDEQFSHAGWSGGVHFADLVFPWFLLIVGVAIPFAAASRRRRSQGRWDSFQRIANRVLWLVLLGCLIDSSVARAPVFGLGVLQLIGLAYGLGSVLYGFSWPMRSIVALLLLLAQWAALRFVPVPGVGTGVFLEGQNLIHYLNQTFLEPYHLRGLPSVIPTTALVLIGTVVGDTLRLKSLSASRKVAILCLGGVILGFAGWLWSFDLPFNKPVWTAPYILFTGGGGILALTLFYLLLDVWKLRSLGLPFVVPGSNAIFAYVVPILVKLHLLQEWTIPGADGARVSLQTALIRSCSSVAGDRGGWLYIVGYIAFWWAVLFVMYRKRIWIKV